MHLNRLKLASAIALVSVLVFGNTAQAATTLSVTVGGTQTTATAIAAGDTLDVTDTAPIPGVGVTDAEISSLWSSQSLQLKPSSSVTYPEGWALEYTTDGTNWSTTAPSPLSRAVGVRTKGNLESTGPNAFKTHPSSNLLQSQRAITGATGGDGYDVTFAQDRVYNQFHHNLSVNVQCHLQSNGNSCTGIDISGYQTPNGASSFYDPASKKLYAVAMQSISRSFGFVCIDLTAIDSPTQCSTPFVRLYTGPNTGSAQADGYREFIGNSSEDASGHVWTFNGANYSLMCLDLSSGAACASDNGKLLPNTGKLAIGTVAPQGLANSGRVSAIDGKVYYVTDSKFGCYDPASHALCTVGGVTVATADQYPPFPIRNSAGTVLGACLYVTSLCINSSEAAIAMPANLQAFISSHTIPAWNTYNAGQWAELGNKLYLNKGPSGTATSDVYCYDFSTAASCSGFNGANVGTQIYAIAVDPNVSNCLWTNGNAGLITTFNATTGLVGCTVGSPVAQMPYSAVTPRMSCSETGRVTRWASIHFTMPSGITRTTLRVTVLDATSGTPTAISGFTDVTVDTNDTLDLTGLNSAGSTAVKRATIQITAGAVSGALLQSVTADVAYEAESPQLCLTLLAKANCAGFTPASGDLSVPDGLIRVASIMTPTTGAAITESHDQTVTGTNAGNLCAASLPNSPTVPPVTTPPPAPRVLVPSLSLTKVQTSLDPTFPGEEVKYSLVAKNDGELPLAGVSISDANATLTNCDPALPVANLDINAEIHCTAVHKVTLADVLAGFISNTAQAADSHSTAATSNTVVTKVKNSPGMTVVKKQISPAPKVIGDVIRYEIKATNTGNTILSNVMVIDNNAEIQFCGPSIPVTQLKLGASITCEATHKVTAADFAAGQVVNVAIAKSDDVVASSETTTNAGASAASSGSPSATSNSFGRIKSNEVVTRLAGSKPMAASNGAQGTSTKPTGKPAKKPTGELAFTGDTGGGFSLVGLLMMLTGATLFVFKRRKIAS